MNTENENQLPKNHLALRLSDNNFKLLSTLVYDLAGIKLTPEKRDMAQGRLLRRIGELRFKDFDEYFSFLLTNRGKLEELPKMLNELTTNKTEFFREIKQFGVLIDKALPDIFAASSATNPYLRIWSAGCSSGEEAFSIAMQINDLCEERGLRYSVLGTDISTDVLTKARTAVYQAEEVTGVPEMLMKKYFMRSKNPDQKQIRVSPEIRTKVEFKYHNLMDSNPPAEYQMDIVFCRNVIIYFDRQTQEAVLTRLVNNLKPGGYFFHGHSESLIGMNLPLQRIQATVYRRI